MSAARRAPRALLQVHDEGRQGDERQHQRADRQREAAVACLRRLPRGGVDVHAENGDDLARRVADRRDRRDPRAPSSVAGGSTCAMPVRNTAPSTSPGPSYTSPGAE